jgi:hypothetical protein
MVVAEGSKTLVTEYSKNRLCKSGCNQGPARHTNVLQSNSNMIGTSSSFLYPPSYWRPPGESGLAVRSSLLFRSMHISRVRVVLTESRLCYEGSRNDFKPQQHFVDVPSTRPIGL